MKLFNKRQRPLPDFWKSYEKSFRKKLPDTITDNRFVALDTETTGFDLKKDRVLCIGAVSVLNNVIDLNDSLELYLHQDTFNPKTVEIHGIIQEEQFEQISAIEAIQEFLAYLKNAVIVAHHAYFDITMINNMLARHDLPMLKNKVLDTGVLHQRTRLRTNLIEQQKVVSLDALAKQLNIPLKDRHTASGDAYITAIAFLKLVHRLRERGLPNKLRRLFWKL